MVYICPLVDFFSFEVLPFQMIVVDDKKAKLFAQGLRIHSLKQIKIKLYSFSYHSSLQYLNVWPYFYLL